MTTSLRGLVGRHADGRGADRRRALGRCERRRAVVVPHRAQAARPPRGRGDRLDAAVGVPRARFRRSASTQARRGRGDPRRRSCFASIRSRAARGRWSTTRAEALLNRTWRPALSVIGADGLPAIANAGNVLRPYDRAGAVAAPAADWSTATRRRVAMKALLETDPPHGAQRDVRAGAGRDRLERAGDAAVARDARSTTRRSAHLRQAGGRDGRGRHDPVHGDARRALPARAVPDHRRARSAFERARAERVPAHRVREAADRVRRATCSPRTRSRR